MWRHVLIIFCCALLFGCAMTHPANTSVDWQRRLDDLQANHSWQLAGRAAVALAGQGWQASLNWQQNGPYAELQLSGPFGVGAMVLEQSAQGLSLNGTPPTNAVMTQVQDRLGFQPPLDHLRFWLLGVSDPGLPADVIRNDRDRAKQLTQDGWSIVYDRYTAVGSDLLPAHVLLSRDDVRVRIVVDHWDWSQ